MADEQRGTLVLAGMLPASVSPCGGGTQGTERGVDQPSNGQVRAHVSATSLCNDMTTGDDGVSPEFARAFAQPPIGCDHPRTGAIAQAPPSFIYFHIRPRGEGHSGFPSEHAIHLTFYMIAKKYQLPLPQYVALPENANATAPGWSLIIGRSVDAQALKNVVRKLKDADIKNLEYDGTEANKLYPSTEAALPSVCGNLHRVGSMSFDMGHVWYGGENNPKRVHVKFRYPNLRFTLDETYQSLACILLRFVHNVLPTGHPLVSALILLPVCRRVSRGGHP